MDERERAEAQGRPIHPREGTPSHGGGPASPASAGPVGARQSTSESGSDRAAVRQLAALAVPTFGQLIAEPAFVLVDTAIVGHVSDSALAGLSLGSTVVLTAVGLCIFLAYATTSQVARLFGAGERRAGLQSGMDSLWLSLAIGVVLATALFAFAEPICAALGGRGDDLANAVLYARAVVVGVPGMLVVYAANGIFRGLQKVRITLLAAVGGAVANTALDVLFVIVLGWGVLGSGVATCIAQWSMGLFLGAIAVRWAVQGGADWRPRLSGIVAAGGDGFPLFVRTLATRASLVATVAVAASLGTEVLAAYQVVNAVWNFALNILDSVAIAGQALVGTQLGAGDAAGVRRLVRITTRAGSAMGVGVGIVLAALGLVVGGVFSPNPEIQALVAVGMVVMAVFQPMQGWVWALDGALIGAGDFRYLAGASTGVATVYLAALAALSCTLLPALGDAGMQAAALWTAFNVVFLGGRALVNGVRVGGDRWMEAAASR